MLLQILTHYSITQFRTVTASLTPRLAQLLSFDLGCLTLGCLPQAVNHFWNIYIKLFLLLDWDLDFDKKILSGECILSMEKVDNAGI